MSEAIMLSFVSLVPHGIRQTFARGSIQTLPSSTPLATIFRQMNPTLRTLIALAAGIASLASGMFWHLSANAQVNSMKLSGQASEALAKLVSVPQPSLAAQQQAIQLSQRAAEALSQLSADQNLYAAICAVVAGLGALLVAYYD